MPSLVTEDSRWAITCILAGTKFTIEEQGLSLNNAIAKARARPMEQDQMPTDTRLSYVTVQGSLRDLEKGLIDAHTHVWIAAKPGAIPTLPRVDDEEVVTAKLAEYKSECGAAVLDAQPGYGCGRDGRMLRALSASSGVTVFACTGFHRSRYYAPQDTFFQSSAQEAFDLFIRELNTALTECEKEQQPVRAGYIKVAAAESLTDTPQQLLEAAAEAASTTGALLAVHTERGAEAEHIFAALLRLRVHPDQIMLCHMDKRPDEGLHRELAAASALLEYDTFFEPRYKPENHVWPLLLSMVGAGLGESIAIGTDLAYMHQWRAEQGIAAFGKRHTRIRLLLQTEGVSATIIDKLQGGNIRSRLHRTV